MKKLTNWIRQAHKFLAQFLDDIRSWSLGEGKRLRLKDGEKPVVLDAQQSIQLYYTNTKSTPRLVWGYINREQ